jgi:hypothetical protein
MTLGTTETTTIGVRGQTPNLGAGVSAQASSARNHGQYRGPFGYGGLSTGESGEIGGGIFGGLCPDAPGGFVGGVEANTRLGFSFPLPAEVHGGQRWTEVKTTASSNPFGWINNALSAGWASPYMSR